MGVCSKNLLIIPQISIFGEMGKFFEAPTIPHFGHINMPGRSFYLFVFIIYFLRGCWSLWTKFGMILIDI